jgi:hypothetical protein
MTWFTNRLLGVQKRGKPVSRPKKPPTVYLGPYGPYNGADCGEVPVPDDMPGVRGVFLGGCVANGIGTRLGNGRRPHHRAHAHLGKEDPFHGWVCFQNPEFLQIPQLRAHELAHVTTDQGHTAAWRAEMTRQGQEIPPRYLRRHRGPKRS